MNDARLFAASGAAHLDARDVTAYVINALALERAAEVEEHVACCEACADALAREAQLEMALEMVAERAAIADAHASSADIARLSDVAPRMESAHAEIAPRMQIAHAEIAPNVVRFPRRPRATRAGIGLGGALAAAAALVLWMMPSAKPEGADDVARLGVSADAAGAIVSFDHDSRPMNPAMDKLDGG